MAVVVVTGPAGHVGANLVRALLAEDQRVRALVHRDRRALEGLGVDRVQGDVRDPDSLHRVFSGALRAADRAPVGERYILSGHWASLRDLAELAKEINGAPIPQLIFPMWMARIGAPFATLFGRLTRKRPLFTTATLRPLRMNRRISHARAARDLDYQPRPLRDTVADTLRWFEAEGL